MKIRAKLFIGMGSLVVALSLMLVESLYFTDRLGTEAVKMYDGPTMTATFSQSAYTNFLRARIYASAGDLDETEFAIDDVLGDLDVVIERSTYKQTQDQSTALYSKVESWFEDVSEGLDDGTFNAEEFTEQDEAIEEALSAIVESVAEEGYWARELAIKLQQDSIIVSLLVAAIGTLIGLAIAIFTGNNVSSSIRSLKKAMDAVTDGNLSYPILTTKNKDETGAMSRSLEGFRQNAATQIAVTAALMGNDVPTLVTDFRGKNIFSNTAFDVLTASVQGAHILSAISKSSTDPDESAPVIDLQWFMRPPQPDQEADTDCVEPQENGSEFTLTAANGNVVKGQRMANGNVEFRTSGLTLACRTISFGERGTEGAGYTFEMRDVTAERTLLDSISAVTAQADQGQFETRIDVCGNNGEIARFAMQLNQFLDVVRSFTTEIDCVTLALANKDLSAQVSDSYKGAFAATQSQFNCGVESLSSTISAVNSTMTKVQSMISLIEDSSKYLSDQAKQQSGELTKSAESVRDLAISFKELSNETFSLADSSQVMSVDVEKSATTISEAVDAMKEVEAASSQVTDIIGVIDSIAFQTNLLALNAAVEAARAGPAGKGFEVVASEVRTLAKRSSESAEHVRRIIKEIATKIVDGAETVKLAHTLMTEVSEKAQRLSHTLQSNSDKQTMLSDEAGARSKEIDGARDATFETVKLTDNNRSAAKALLEAEKEISSELGVLKLTQSCETSQTGFVAKN